MSPVDSVPATLVAKKDPALLDVVNNRVTFEIQHNELRYVITGIPSAMGSFGYVPPERTKIPAASYFNTPTRLRRIITDQAPSQYGYDQKAKHENRRNSMRHVLRICEEEENRAGPVLSSSDIGRFWQDTNKVDVFKFPHPHIPCIEQEFVSPVWRITRAHRASAETAAGLKSRKARQRYALL